MVRIFLLVSVFTVPSISAEAFNSEWSVEFEKVGDSEISLNSDTNTLHVGQGKQFRANVFVSSDQEFKALDLTFGWGSAESMGTDATNLNNSIVLNDVVIDPDGLFDTHIIPAGENDGLSGFRQLGDTTGSAIGTRPYGQYLSLYNQAGAISAPLTNKLKIASFLFTNNVAEGSMSSLSLWDAAAGSSYTSMLVDSASNYSRPGGSKTYNINSAPEPGSLLALAGVGSGAVISRIRQFRRRKAA